MMLPSSYLLDTNILLALLRGNALGLYIRATYPIFGQTDKPYISAVTKGEIRSLARQFGWGPVKLQLLSQFLALEITSVEIDHNDIMDADVEVDCYSHSHPKGSVKMGKNDLWIAATARARSLTLLTTDKDFDHLHPAMLQRVYIDPTSALPSTPIVP